MRNRDRITIHRYFVTDGAELHGSSHYSLTPVERRSFMGHSHYDGSEIGINRVVQCSHPYLEISFPTGLAAKPIRIDGGCLDAIRLGRHVYELHEIIALAQDGIDGITCRKLTDKRGS